MKKRPFTGHWMLIGYFACIFSFCVPVPSVIAQGHDSGTQSQGTQLGEMVIISDKIEDFSRQNPSQVVTMEAKEIEQRNFLQVQEVLGAMPGVDVKDSGAGMGTRISIRGGGGSGSVLVLIDGRPASTMQYGGVDLSSIPIDLIKKITVFKPPVPVWLGPDSAAGAIYIETKQKKAKTKTGIKGKVRATGGSYGLAALSATAQMDKDKSQYTISGGASHKDGKRTNSQKDQGNLNLGYNWKKGTRALQVNGKAYISDHGVAGPTYNPTPNATQRYEKGSLDVKYSDLASFADYTVKAWTDIKKLDETANNGDKSTLDTFTAGLGSDLFFTPKENDDDELRVGLQLERNRVDHTLSGKHNRSSAGGHAEYNIRTKPCTYTLGARADYTNDYHFSPGGHAGVSYNFSDATQIRLNAGYSEHIPTFSQLYQPSHGAIDQVRGNPDLDKEKNISMSLGLDQKIRDNQKLSASLFRTDSRDLIKYERDSFNVSSPENVDKAYKQGVELSYKYSFSKKTDLEFNYILQETENKDNGCRLSYAPTHSGKMIFKTEFKTKTRFEWITRGYSKQYSDNENTEDETLDPYLTTDIKLTQPVTIFTKKSLVFFNIRNLFDKDYSSHYGYPDDGIRFEAGLSINF